MTRWLRQLFGRTPVAPVVKSQRTRLGVHPLEDRVVPAVTVGALDPLFDSDGKVTHNIDSTNSDDEGRAVAIQADGKIVVAGSYRLGAIEYHWAVWRYNPDGSHDATFGSSGSGVFGLDFTADGGSTLDHRASAVVIQSDGKIVVGGFSSTATNGRDMTVVRLNTNGTIDTTFDTDGLWTRPTRFGGDDEVTALAQQSDGQIVLAGYRTYTAPDTDFYVTRLTSAGVIDTTIDRSVAFDLGSGNTDKATAVVVQADGKIVVAGHATTPSFSIDIAVARINTDGNMDATFDTDGELTLRFAESALPDIASGVAIQSDGKIVLGGTVQTATSTGTDVGVIRLNANGSYDTTFDGDGKQTAHFSGNDEAYSLALQPDGKIVLAGTTNAQQADSDPLLVRVNVNGSLDTSFDGDGIRRIAFDLGGTITDKLSGLALDASGRVVGVGSAATASNGTDLALLRVFGRDIPLVVDTTADGIDANLATGKLSLREAIALSNIQSDADTITFTEGLNGSTITLGGTRLEVRRPVSITGPSQGVALDGNLQSQVFYFDGQTNGTYAASLQNLTVTRGRTGANEETTDNGDGSGLYGGGIFNYRANLSLTHVTISNNQSPLGAAGGIMNWQGANSKLSIRQSLFVGNTTGAGGGALFNQTDATVTVVNTAFSGNSANSSGGGILQNGGAIDLTHVTSTLNVTDSDNNGSGTGGFLGIISGTVTMHNSIVAGNVRGPATADEISGNSLAGTSSFNVIAHTGTSGGLTNGTGGNQVGVNPLLQPLANNGGRTRTHALGQNSPALGKASVSVANYSVYDQRGTARDPGAPDVGAYEVQHPLAPVGVPTTNATLFAPKPSATANEAFVKGLYQATLLRAPDTGGLANWLAALAGGATRDAVANGFVNSLENRRTQVTFFYRYFLSREPDSGGLTHWVDRLRGGEDEGSVMTGFVLSAEFSGTNSNTQFVNLMYYALLGREADTAGLNDWLNNLNGGMSRATVVQSLLRSEEGLNRVIRSLFQAYLKREADTGGVNTFRTALLNGTTFGQVAISVLGGQEFFNNAAANMS